MYKDFYFAVFNRRGQLVATFSRRWEAEKYAEEKGKGHVVQMINI